MAPTLESFHGVKLSSTRGTILAPPSEMAYHFPKWLQGGAILAPLFSQCIYVMYVSLT